MVLGSPPPLAHEVLSEPPSCTRTCLRDGHAVNTLALWWRFRWGILLAGYYTAKKLIGHNLQGNVVLLRPREPQPEWTKSSRLGYSVAN